MTAVYLVLGLPGSGRHEIVTNLIADGLEEPQAVSVYHAADEAAPPTPGLNVTFVPYTFANGEFTIGTDNEPATEPQNVFFLTDGRKLVIDQLEVFQTWLNLRGWELARIILVVDCALAMRYEDVVLWHEACLHFADCALLNNRNAETHQWATQFQKKFHELRYPCQFFLVKKGQVDLPLVVLYPEARRLTMAFDQFDAIDDLDLDEEDLPDEPFTLERKPDPYFVRMPNGHREKYVPDVTKYLGK
jgi:hypothetical protein